VSADIPAPARNLSERYVQRFLGTAGKLRPDSPKGRPQLGSQTLARWIELKTDPRIFPMRTDMFEYV
jgi:hypothetical protein